jgi:hypothetical protein
MISPTVAAHSVVLIAARAEFEGRALTCSSLPPRFGGGQQRRICPRISDELSAALTMSSAAGPLEGAASPHEGSLWRAARSTASCAPRCTGLHPGMAAARHPTAVPQLRVSAHAAGRLALARVSLQWARGEADDSATRVAAYLPEPTLLSSPSIVSCRSRMWLPRLRRSNRSSGRALHQRGASASC